jgi:hypothetical protein
MESEAGGLTFPSTPTSWSLAAPAQGGAAAAAPPPSVPKAPKGLLCSRLDVWRDQAFATTFALTFAAMQSAAPTLRENLDLGGFSFDNARRCGRHRSCPLLVYPLCQPYIAVFLHATNPSTRSGE